MVVFSCDVSEIERWKSGRGPERVSKRIACKTPEKEHLSKDTVDISGMCYI